MPAPFSAPTRPPRAGAGHGYTSRRRPQPPLDRSTWRDSCLSERMREMQIRCRSDAPCPQKQHAGQVHRAKHTHTRTLAHSHTNNTHTHAGTHAHTHTGTHARTQITCARTQIAHTHARTHARAHSNSTHAHAGTVDTSCRDTVGGPAPRPGERQGRRRAEGRIILLVVQ